MKKSLLVFLAVVIAVVAWRCLLFVDETQYVIVTQFGRPVATLSEAGLYFKPPYQSALAIDRRMQIYNPRPSEFLTSEKKNVDLDVYVLWSVEDPQKFIETVNDAAGAGSRIHDVVWSKLAAAVGRNPLESLVSIDSKSHGLEPLVQKVETECANEVHDKYGIRIVDVRIKRIGLPEQVRESVFDRHAQGTRPHRAALPLRRRRRGDENPRGGRQGAGGAPGGGERQGRDHSRAGRGRGDADLQQGPSEGPVVFRADADA